MSNNLIDKNFRSEAAVILFHIYIICHRLSIFTQLITLLTYFKALKPLIDLTCYLTDNHIFSWSSIRLLILFALNEHIMSINLPHFCLMEIQSICWE